MQRVVIIGGGISGLAVAHELARVQKYDITVIEKSPDFGGLAGTIEFEGLHLDVGSHRIHPKADPGALGLLRELLGDSLLERPRAGEIRFRNQWMSYPPSLAEMAMSYSPGSMVQVATSWMATRLRTSNASSRETFEGALISKFGRKLFEDFYRPYAEKLWGLPPDRISSVAAEQRAQRFSVGRAISDLMRWVTSSEAKHSFLYPAEGFGQISRCLEDRLRSLGVNLLKNTSVERLQYDASGTRVVGLFARTQDATGSLLDVPADWVVSTVPLHSNLSLMEKSGQPALTPALRLQFRHLRLVYLMTKDRPVTQGETLYLPGSESRFGRVSFPLRYRKQEGVEPSLQPVIVEAPCSVGDEIWEMDEKLIIELCKKDLVDLRIFKELEIEASKAVRIPNVYPIYEMGWDSEFRRGMEYLERSRNFISVGRSALFLHCNIDHCISMSMALARILTEDPNPNETWVRKRSSFHDFTPHE